VEELFSQRVHVAFACVYSKISQEQRAVIFPPVRCRRPRRCLQTHWIVLSCFLLVLAIFAEEHLFA